MRLGLRGAQAALLALLCCETAFVYAHFDDWALRSFSAASVGLLACQLVLAPPAASLAPESIATTFGVLGLGGLGLMAQVWVNVGFR